MIQTTLLLTRGEIDACREALRFSNANIETHIANALCDMALAYLVSLLRTTKTTPSAQRPLKESCPWCGKAKKPEQLECDDCKGKEHGIEF